MMMHILVIFLIVVLSTVQPKYYLVETAEGAKPNFTGETGKDYSAFCESHGPGDFGLSCVDYKVVTVNLPD
jgi:hypothetical protein